MGPERLLLREVPHQPRYGGLEMLWLEMGVDFGDFRTGMTQKLLDFVECGARLDQPRGGGMTKAVEMQQIVETSIPYIPLEQMLNPVPQYGTIV